MAIIPIPTTRVSDALVSQRLLSQLTADQLAILRLQNAVSTGQRLALASEDAPAALRAISLQSLLERKNQVTTNVQATQSYLGATDSALSVISGLLADARGTAVSVSDSTSSDTQRAAAANEINNAIQQIVNTGNQQFRGRYLFAGAKSSQAPFQTVGNFVRYDGDRGNLSSFTDLGFLFQASISGDQSFGAISTPVEGTADLNPILTLDTKLADLRGGQGIRLGSVSITDGTQTSTIDLSGADTIGDVVARLEAHPPLGRNVTVDVTATGLNISLDTAGGGSLKINDAGGGKTASDLGIQSTANLGVGPVVGSDLTPRLSATTSVQDILGARASVRLESTGSDNDLQITAVQRGTALNGVTVSFVDNPGVTAGNETVLYDDSNPANKKLIFQIDAGNTTAANVLSALNNDPIAGALFQATLTGRDASDLAMAGTGVVDVGTSGVTAGGAGIEPDLASGLQISNGGMTYVVDLSSAKTIEDVLNAINGSGAAALAELNDTGTGINVRSRLSGADFSIGENGGQTATQLGLRTFIGSTQLADLNHSGGVHELSGDDFIIRRKDGAQIGIDVAGATTIQFIIDRINNAPNNQNPATQVVARLAQSGNGIELTTSDTSTAATFAVLKVNHSLAAEDLGLIPTGLEQSAPAASSGGVETITGRDVNPAEVSGILNALIRIHQALLTNDQPGLQRAVALLDDGTVQLNFARAEIGSRQQTLDAFQQRHEQESIDLKDALSKEIDTDFAQTTVDLLARQTTFQATLQLTAQISQQTLLNYL